MNRKDMEQLRALRQELNTLNERYLHMPKSEEVADTYGDYRTGRKKRKVVRGYSSKRADNLKDKIDGKTNQLQAMIIELEEFLDSIESSEIRDIFRLYYVEGMTQEQIGDRKGYSRSAIGNKIDTFWDKQTN